MLCDVCIVFLPLFNLLRPKRIGKHVIGSLLLHHFKLLVMFFTQFLELMLRVGVVVLHLLLEQVHFLLQEMNLLTCLLVQLLLMWSHRCSHVLGDNFSFSRWAVTRFLSRLWWRGWLSFGNGYSLWSLLCWFFHCLNLLHGVLGAGRLSLCR